MRSALIACGLCASIAGASCFPSFDLASCYSDAECADGLLCVELTCRAAPACSLGTTRGLRLVDPEPLGAEVGALDGDVLVLASWVEAPSVQAVVARFGPDRVATASATPLLVTTDGPELGRVSLDGDTFLYATGADRLESASVRVAKVSGSDAAVSEVGPIYGLGVARSGDRHLLAWTRGQDVEYAFTPADRLEVGSVGTVARELDDVYELAAVDLDGRAFVYYGAEGVGLRRVEVAPGSTDPDPETLIASPAYQVREPEVVTGGATPVVLYSDDDGNPDRSGITNGRAMAWFGAEPIALSDRTSFNPAAAVSRGRLGVAWIERDGERGRVAFTEHRFDGTRLRPVAVLTPAEDDVVDVALGAVDDRYFLVVYRGSAGATIGIHVAEVICP